MRIVVTERTEEGTLRDDLESPILSGQSALPTRRAAKIENLGCARIEKDISGQVDHRYRDNDQYDSGAAIAPSESLQYNQRNHHEDGHEQVSPGPQRKQTHHRSCQHKHLLPEARLNGANDNRGHQHRAADALICAGSLGSGIAILSE